MKELKLKNKVLFLLLVGHFFASAQKKPNVIFIVVDDLRTDLGCYGNTQIKTPNLDKFASQSLRFRKAYCQQAVCGPSRASMLTGQFPESINIFDLQHPVRKYYPNLPTISSLFKDAGYKTISVGKVFHNPTDDKENWEYLDSQKPRSMYLGADTYKNIASKKEELRKTDPALADLYRGPTTEGADVADSAYDDFKSVDKAISELKKAKDAPFLLCLGIYKPHLPFVAPKKYWDLYNRNGIAKPVKATPAGASMFAGIGWKELEHYADVPDETKIAEEKAMELKNGYYACVSFIDEQIGRFLKEVKNLGLDENTIIVFTSDHGWKLGEYGLWAKHTNYEVDTHVPMMIKTPEMKIGTVSNSVVQNVDILPTLVDLCKLKVTLMDGVSYAQLTKNPNAKIHDCAFSQFPRENGVMGYSLTDGNYRYTVWTDWATKKPIETELYDHRKTDIAKINLHGKKEYAAMEAKFAKTLKDLNPHFKNLANTNEPKPDIIFQ
ncbi:MAG: sulfatase [Chitinophagaceae bacterium]